MKKEFLPISESASKVSLRRDPGNGIGWMPPFPEQRFPIYVQAILELIAFLFVLRINCLK